MKIGKYEIIKSIAKGGMGEVLLAFDPIFKREIALKRIREDLKNTSVFKNRFLREAELTANLTHPGIISIYSIYHEGDDIYYTMPFVHGNTLKQLLRKDENIAISKVLPIFKSVCQTVAYAHSKGIIHRDLKPENILVGNFGEVILLDWGLAEHAATATEIDYDIKETHPDLTHPGKIVGTLAYMAPERALGQSATMQTDIYALGVILYQILTLHLPFERSSLKEFRKNFELESYIDPEEIAPYRDVPPPLSRMVKKLLCIKKEDRYQTMDELMFDLLSYMEGRSEWFESKKLAVTRKKDWEFQENLLISKHIAITRTTESATWLSIMISKNSFSENIRLETEVFIGKEGAGIGFLLNVPEAAERESPLSGYCLWLGTEEEPYCQLLRNTVEAIRVEDLYLKKQTWHKVIIEKSDNHISLIVDGVQRFKYVSHLPLVGTHVGVVSRDADYEMKEIIVAVGGQTLQVSCLAIPDAFLASRDYKKALAEYRRIGYTFAGHAEGRQALFLSGITLLEQAKTLKSAKKAESTYILALEEFSKLHQTPGAPLEYLGKALVYQTLHDHNEEIKCLDLAIRRYHKHPLIAAIKEQIIYRMHESAQNDRRSAYRLILIALQQIPEVLQNSDTISLFRHLIMHGEPLPFFENPIEPSLIGKDEKTLLDFIQFLAFWLANVNILTDLCEKNHDSALIGNIIYSLFEIGSYTQARKLMNENKKETTLFEPIALCHEEGFRNAVANLFSQNIEEIGTKEFRTISYLLQYALSHGQEDMVESIATKYFTLPLGKEERIALDAYRIWAALALDQWEKAAEIFETYPYELLNQESTLLHPLFGCYLFVTEGEEIANIHFAGVIDTPFPRTWALLGHELTSKISENPSWEKTAFMYEKRQLYKQLTLYYHCTGNVELETFYRHKEKEQYLYTSD